MISSAEKQSPPENPLDQAIKLLHRMNTIYKSQDQKDLPIFFDDLAELQTIKLGPKNTPVTSLEKWQEVFKVFGQDPLIKNEMTTRLQQTQNPVVDAQNKQSARLLGLLPEEETNKSMLRELKLSRRGFLKWAALATAGATLPGDKLLLPIKIASNFSPQSISSSPSETLKPQSTEEKITSVNEFMKYFIDLAIEKRRKRLADPTDESIHSVDQNLNTNLVNFVLSAWSEGQGESLTVLSYNTKTGKITSVSCTRETICPEVIRYNSEKNPQQQKEEGAYSLEAGGNMFLYHTGSFDLMRKVVENETGLCADFQIYMDEMFLHDFIKDVLGDKIEMEVKNDLYLRDQPWSRFGYEEEGFRISKGKYLMTADQALRYILASDFEFVPGKGNSPPGRKNDLIVSCFTAASKAFKQESSGFIGNVVPFILKQKLQGKIDTDFSIPTMVGILKDVAPRISKGSFGLPEVEKNDLMINDTDFGDGGLIRVHKIINKEGEISENYHKLHPNMRKLIDKTLKMIATLKSQGINVDDQILARRGVIPLWAQIPLTGDPEAPDLARNYWYLTRKLVETRLGNTKSLEADKSSL